MFNSLLKNKVLKTTTAIFLFATFAHSLDESTVFQWWDNGLIAQEEASEMLILLEEGNEEEACLLAENFALESCEVTPKKEVKNKAPVAPHGFVLWKGRTDSLGHLESSRAELQMEFYRFRLRLGTQELLTYKNDGSEAHFGQISTREFRSFIPLDTLWGTSLQYPIGNFYVGGALDSALNMQARLGYKIRKNATAEIFSWRSQESVSLGLQGKTSWGEFSGWWQKGNELPLIKMQLQNTDKLSHDQEADRKKSDRKNSSTLSWKISAYFHGDSIPEQAHLSKSIAANKFWGSQTVSFTDGGDWRTKISTSARIQIPFNNSNSSESTSLGFNNKANQVSARFKLQGESGPQILRSMASATCLDASQNCRQTDFKMQLSSQISESQNEGVNLQTNITSRYIQGKNFSTPRLEASATYSHGSLNKSGITLLLPKANPNKSIQLQTQANVGTERFQTRLAVTFKRKQNENFHPVHAYLQIRVNF